MDKRLWEAALSAMRRAHAPYSHFRVGAAVLSDSGKIYAGCNVENASYPEGICAETAAIAAMVSDGGMQIKEIAIVGESDDLLTPCGGCRQRIREFGDSAALIHSCGSEGLRRSFTLAELLPHSFGPSHLS